MPNLAVHANNTILLLKLTTYFANMRFKRTGVDLMTSASTAELMRCGMMAAFGTYLTGKGTVAFPTVVFVDADGELGAGFCVPYSLDVTAGHMLSAVIGGHCLTRPSNHLTCPRFDRSNLYGSVSLDD